MDYFTKIGTQLAEHCGEGELNENFPEIAGQLLEESTPPDDFDLQTVLDWSLQSDELPRQVNFQSGFGQPPLVVFQEPRFYLELLIWFPSRTSIHGHGFVGAFMVLSGYSIEAKYRFIEKREVCHGVKLGELKPESVEVIAPGKVNRILNGDGFIHTVGHMGNPSMTLVVRNRSSKHPRQFTYFTNGIAIDRRLHNRSLARQAQMLRAYNRVRPDAFDGRLRDFVANGNAHRAAMILRLLDDLLVDNRRLDFLDHLRLQFGALADLFDEAWSSQKRRQKIWHGLQFINDPEAQLTGGLRDLFPDFEKLKWVLAKTYPNRTPEDTLTTWLKTARVAMKF